MGGTGYLLVGPLPEDGQGEDGGNGWGQATGHKLDVDVELAAVGRLQDGDPHNAHHHQDDGHDPVSNAALREGRWRRRWARGAQPPSGLYLPTRSSSFSEACGRCFFQMSMVKRVELLLKMEVSEDIRAAIITAIMSPRKPATHRWKRPLTPETPPTHTHTLTLSVSKVFEGGVLTAGHELNDQFGKGDVGASHLCTTHSHTLLWIHTPHRV